MTIASGSTGTTEPAVRHSPPAGFARFGTPVVFGWTFLLSLALLWPLASPGMLLLRDMVVPPHPALTDAAFGLGDSAARATPQDAVLAWVGGLTDAGAVVRLLLVAGFLFGGLAAAELARRTVGAGLLGQLAAVTMLLWNPFTVERLLQGQWSLVLAMVLLPAIVVAGLQGAAWWRATAMAVAGLTPTGAVLGGVVAVVAARTWRDRGVAALTAMLVSAPWVAVSLPGAVGGGAAEVFSDPSGAAAFAARAERHVGTLGAVAGLGGIWNRQAVPLMREEGPAALTVVGLLALFAIGAARAWRPRGDAALNRRLIVLAGLAVAVPALLATPPGLQVMEWALANLPGAGLARDAQKFVALAVPGYAILAAAGAETLAGLLPTARQWLAGAFAVLIIVSAVPDAPRAVAELSPVEPWPGWSPVSGLVAMDHTAVAVLPAGSYRIIAGRPTYDPAVKTLPADVVGTGDLTVSGVTVGGEGTAAREVEQALLDAPDTAIDVLRGNGVGWVLVENSPGEMGDSARVLDQLEVLYEDAELRLHRVPGAIAYRDDVDRTPAYAGLALWGLALLAGPVAAVIRDRGAGRRR